MTCTIGSLFSGIGGIDLAAHWAGFQTVWMVEKDAFCQSVLCRHWPDVLGYGDIFGTRNLPYVDVVAGGFPCQPFSVAGKRRGKADDRYLLPEMLRIVSEVQPRVVFFENVPGFASLNDGAEFRWLLRTLAEMRYDAEWCHLRASDFGAPHQRERWLLVAYTTSPRLERPHRKKPPIPKPTRFRGRAAQPGLGRDVNGFPGRLDFPGWPAGRGQAQHDHEPPRVTSGKSPNRAARIKALGNAVVPQQVYPIFAAIHDWLATQ